MVTFGALGNLDGSEQIRTVRLATTENQFELFKRLYDSYENVFILESLVGPEELAEMSVIGFGPEITVTCDFQKFTVRENRKVVHQAAVTDPLMQLREIMPKVKDNRSRYIGGAVGYIGYDAVRFWERLPAGKKKDGNYPLL
ncbi:MAG TPA: anthranilate synthase component I, partial [Nitrososphaera sp.]